MEKFVRLEGLVAPLDRNNVDTDAIIPKQFLKSIKRSGFGPNAFDEWQPMVHPGPDRAAARCEHWQCRCRIRDRVGACSRFADPSTSCLSRCGYESAVSNYMISRINLVLMEHRRTQMGPIPSDW